MTRARTTADKEATVARSSDRNTQRKIFEFPQVGKKLIVLDTSVLLHDPESLFRFEEHDVFLPRQVLAQLDRHKKGQTDVARNARQVTRTIDSIFKGDKKLLRDGASMADVSKTSATGKLFFQMEPLSFPLPKDMLDDDADRRIIGVACALRRERKSYGEVVLVTKDANMRYAALGVVNGNIVAEDYLNDKVLLKDSDVLPTGYQTIPKNFWDDLEVVDAGTRGHHKFWQVRGSLCSQLEINDCVHVEDEHLDLRVRKHSGAEMLLESITDYRNDKHKVWGIHARNIEQCYALNHLMNPDIDLTILLGDAGTGKSICALAAGFEYLGGAATHDDQQITKIILTRAMVPVGGEDMGYLPGDVNDKFGPWMLALEDTKEALFNNAKKLKNWNETQVEQFRGQISLQPIGLIAGRTLANSFVIVDEAQNLTSTTAKMLVTRAGFGSKFVFCGNLSQIDSPYLDEKSSGLAYLVMRMKGHERVAHVILQECVRSRLAALAVERL
jgi:PhoH-like ATPase